MRRRRFESLPSAAKPRLGNCKIVGGKANELLKTARYLAHDFDSEHELKVFALNRSAWANMEQWRFAEAQQYFNEANLILTRISHTTGPVEDLKTVQAKSENSSTPKSASGIAAPADDPRWSEWKLILGYDHNAIVRYLHHLHGLAMAKRFQGQEQEAIEDYRLIVQMTAHDDDASEAHG